MMTNKKDSHVYTETALGYDLAYRLVAAASTSLWAEWERTGSPRWEDMEDRYEALSTVTRYCKVMADDAWAKALDAVAAEAAEDD